MTATDARDLAAAFGIAGLGGALFWGIGLPAPMLTGGAAAVSIAALAGLRVDLPMALRNAFFLLLGMNIGTGVTPQVLASVPGWWVSILALAVSLGVTLGLGAALLVRAFGYDRRTAVLSSAPGHLSFVLSLGLESGADVARIGLTQSVRLLILTLMVPPLVAAVFGATGVSVLPPTVMSLGHLAITAVLGALLGWVFLRINVPAALLLSGMAVSATAHGLDLTPGRVPDALTTLAFAGMGVLIGSRFTGARLADLRAVLGAGLVTSGVALASAGLAGLVVLWAQGMNPALVVVAFAPGGVEAMSAIGIALGLDPAFIAGHHVARIVLLTGLIPLFLGRRGDP